ncbi:MAG: hypothetical protein EZS28_030111 [Streblomastix strix]|uniref:Uncharacterized protein n=1 Tax=Streblomastix strix TaxID=222440 RepID=A0A5J4UWS6_9EUKA|nr:MAG: hypothetical protein EZS28_030111 [Streblomastix strix]
MHSSCSIQLSRGKTGTLVGRPRLPRRMRTTLFYSLLFKLTHQTFNDPFKRLKNPRNLTTKFFFDLANKDKQASNEYMNCQIPSFITLFLPECLHLL